MRGLFVHADAVGEGQRLPASCGPLKALTIDDQGDGLAHPAWGCVVGDVDAPTVGVARCLSVGGGLCAPGAGQGERVRPLGHASCGKGDLGKVCAVVAGQPKAIVGRWGVVGLWGGCAANDPLPGCFADFDADHVVRAGPWRVDPYACAAGDRSRVRRVSGGDVVEQAWVSGPCDRKGTRDMLQSLDVKVGRGDAGVAVVPSEGERSKVKGLHLW